jgi:hypothetical protein
MAPLRRLKAPPISPSRARIVAFPGTRGGVQHHMIAFAARSDLIPGEARRAWLWTWPRVGLEGDILAGSATSQQSRLGTTPWRLRSSLGEKPCPMYARQAPPLFRTKGAAVANLKPIKCSDPRNGPGPVPACRTSSEDSALDPAPVFHGTTNSRPFSVAEIKALHDP